MTYHIKTSTYSYDALNDIYHSTSASEMQVKADLHNVDLHDIDVIAWLLNTTAYHHAFWPHTAKRFTAFKSLLRKFKDLPSNNRFDELKRIVDGMVNCISCDSMRMSTPGGRQQAKNLEQVRSILEKLENEHSKSASA